MNNLILPRIEIKPHKGISSAFLANNLFWFDDCVHYIHQLPYGRNTHRDDFSLVLEENKGTCSTKHALIKALADEQNILLSLVLGIFLTTSDHDPRIAPLLEKYNLPAIPEAHCFLKFREVRFDITFSGEIQFPSQDEIINEYLITPTQIGKYKVQKHKDFIDAWIAENHITYSAEQIWDIREEWINLLSATYSR